jgi:hypothetical protein
MDKNTPRKKIKKNEVNLDLPHLSPQFSGEDYIFMPIYFDIWSHLLDMDAVSMDPAGSKPHHHSVLGSKL